jgi:hypothetical protein
MNLNLPIDIIIKRIRMNQEAVRTNTKEENIQVVVHPIERTKNQKAKRIDHGKTMLTKDLDQKTERDPHHTRRRKTNN